MGTYCCYSNTALNLVDTNNSQTISNKTLSNDTISGILNATSGTNIGTGSTPLNNIITTYVTTSYLIPVAPNVITFEANLIPPQDNTYGTLGIVHI